MRYLNSNNGSVHRKEKLPTAENANKMRKIPKEQSNLGTIISYCVMETNSSIFTALLIENQCQDELESVFRYISTNHAYKDAEYSMVFFYIY